MDNLTGPSYESPVRRYVVTSTSNTEHTPPPVTLNRLKGLLKGNTLIAKSQESADPSSPKKTGAGKKEVAVKIQGGATIKLCSSCATNNKIEEKVQPKRRKSVAKDEGEEKPKRTNKKKQDETAEVPAASKDKKILSAKKETAGKIPKPRNTRKKATDDKENELLVDGNADALSSNEAQAETDTQQLTQDGKNNNKKSRIPRAVKPKNTSKKDSETEETAKNKKKTRQRNAKKNTAVENIEPGLERMNVTDLVNSIIEKNKTELAHNNEMSEKTTNNPVMEDDHITKRVQKKSSKTTIDKKKPKQDIAKNNDVLPENSEEAFKDLNITDLMNSINEKIKIDEATNSTLKESSFDALFSSDDMHMEHSQNSSSSIQHKNQETSATNAYKDKLRMFDHRMKTKNTSQQNSELSMGNMNVTELFNDIYEQNKTQDDSACSQSMNFNSSVPKEASQSQLMDSEPPNISKISKNQGAIKKDILTKDKITKVKKTQDDNVESQEISVNSSAQKEASQSQVIDSQPENTSQISKTQGAIKKGILTKDKITKVKKTQVKKTQDDNVETQEISVNSSAQKEASQSQLMDSLPQNTSQISKTKGVIKKGILTKDKKTKDNKVNVSHEKTSTQKQPINDAKTKKLDESKSKKAKKNISNENVEPEYHAENLNNLNIKSEPNDNHDISSSNMHDSNINFCNGKEYDVDDDGKKTGYKQKLGLDYKLQVVEPDSSKKVSKSKMEKSSNCLKKEKSSRCNKKSKSNHHLSKEENQVISATETKRERRKSLKQLKKQRTVNKALTELNKQFANIHIGKIGQLHIGSQLADSDSDSNSECSSSCSCWEMSCDEDCSCCSSSSSDCSDSETVYTSSTASSSSESGTSESESETTESESSEDSERDCKRKNQKCKKYNLRYNSGAD